MYNDKIQGVDLSRWNEGVDWAKAKTIPEWRFVYARASQGLNYADSMFKSHRAGAITSGKDFGAYHFLDYFNYIRGQEVDFGRKQADYFWSLIKDNPGQLPFVLDIEKNDGASWGAFDIFQIGRILKIALAWHTRMKELTGRFGGDYCSGWVTASMSNFKEGFIWIPRYKAVNGVQPVITRFLTLADLSAYPMPTFSLFPKATIFQYASTLKLGAGYMDADIFAGSEAEYSAFLGNTAVTTDPIVNEDAPVPIATVEGKKATVITSVNVRNGVGTSASQLSVNGSPYVLLKGETFPVYETAYDSRGNPWLRIGYKEWICAEYNGVKLAGLS